VRYRSNGAITHFPEILTMLVKITVKQLHELNACYDGIEAFCQYTNEEEFLWTCETQIEVLKSPLKYYLNWAFCKNLLPIWSMEDINLQGADLQKINLKCFNLCCANLQGADLQYANLSFTNLRYANLRGANLQYAELYCTNLQYASLQNANLQNANLQCANLQNAKLTGTLGLAQC
jgi:uncharacterized protein YjbI with pentapeptide repeats